MGESLVGWTCSGLWFWWCRRAPLPVWTRFCFGSGPGGEDDGNDEFGLERLLPLVVRGMRLELSTVDL